MIRRSRFHEALAVQDAVNLSGVARSFVEIVDDAKRNPLAYPGFESTMAPTDDPAVRLFVYKLASLCGQDNPNSVVDRAWADCERIRDERDAVRS